MRIETIGDINVSYVQNLCLIYFPGAKFGSEEQGSDTLPYVRASVQPDEHGYAAHVYLRTEEGETDAEYFFDNSVGYPPSKAAQLAVGGAFFNVGEKFYGYTPPWGILTGIRPAKIAENFYTEMGTKTAVKKRMQQEYLLTPKKAQLVTDVAVRERKNLAKFGPDTCSLYVSIPFCPTRCAYCSFISYATKRLLSLIPEYLEQLLRDIDEVADVIAENGHQISTIYIGGGTPTTLDERQLEKLLTKLAERFPVASLKEFTLEAGRPDTVTPEKLRIAKNCGVTRVSINPQTLNDEVLKGIGRFHTVAQFYEAFDMARASGISCINTDLIAGLPGDNFKSFAATMDKILAMRPENITVHTFCVKRSAELTHSGADIFSRSGDIATKSVDYSQLMCMKSEYHPYYLYRQKNMAGNLENVGYTLNGFDGYYNSLIMAETHHIYAVGAGAVTKLLSKSGKIKRFYMPKYPYEYLDPVKGEELRRAFFNDLRTFDFS